MKLWRRSLWLCLLLIAPALWGQVANFEKVGQVWKTDLSRHTVPLSELTAHLPRDVIPPIDNPVFISIQEAKTAYFEHEPAIVLDLNGEAKAYPLNVLTYHEIVNDRVGAIPLTITYCPLCNASVVFDRRLIYNNEEFLLDFGVSGMLRKSDLVMWDRQTESWWQQFTGEAIVGKFAGESLNMVESMIIPIGKFISDYPEGKVLSKALGFEKQSHMYGKNFYFHYDSTGKTKPGKHFNDAVDRRLPPMERIVNVEIDGEAKIYPLSTVRQEGIIHDQVANTEIVIFHQYGTVSILDERELEKSRDIGSVTVFKPEMQGSLLTFSKTPQGFIDDQTGSLWSISGKCLKGLYLGQQLSPVFHGNHFAFAWFAFHPNSRIYRSKEY